MLIVALALGAAVAPPALADEQTVRIRGGTRVVAIGPWQPGFTATLSSATRALGAPARVRRSGRGLDCEARWPARGLRVQFESFSGDPCAQGFAGPVWMTRRSRWRTERRLTIGMRVEQLLERYPAARRGRLPWIGSAWLLLPREEVCIGDCGGDETITVSALWAKTRDGRVVRFFTHLGGAGE